MTQHSKVSNFHFNGLLLTKGYKKYLIFELKITEELCVKKLKGDAIFKEKLARGLKNYIRNLVNFHASNRKSENLHFDGYRAYKILDEKVQKSYVLYH